MHAAPQSWSALGSSPRSTIPSATEPTGWIVRIIEVSAAGSRGSEIEISSQPAEGQAGTRSSTPSASAITSEAAAATQVASNSGPAGRRWSSLPCRRIRMKPA